MKRNVFCRCADTGPWSVQVVEDCDGHLNIYVTNSESDRLLDVEGDQSSDELHYRITTEELEMAYRGE